MTIWYWLAFLLPALMVVIFSMIVRNKYTGMILSVIVIGVSVYKGFFHSEMIVFLDTVSLMIGYLIVEFYKLDQVQD
ncbi:CsbA family protein [Macrococcus capreoli]|uniref:CsbA family protein n=1 Tax=Macrococcus capreoli TaxID=2982690 RepID=UPI0021D5817B|nr:CsbA family protein [Macrococcus sp. TMW 2.2395]MCU7556314.1 CsbA family protein [Macrococcus sp. TMW 2.2395]